MTTKVYSPTTKHLFKLFLPAGRSTHSRLAASRLSKTFLKRNFIESLELIFSGKRIGRIWTVLIQKLTKAGKMKTLINVENI